MRAIVRALLMLVLVVVVAVLLLNYWPAGWSFQKAGTGPASPGSGTPGTINTERARERAADIGEKAAAATKRLQENLGEAGVTTKIKAKMALDDSLEGGSINVSTEGSTVTVSGTVPSAAAHTRAIALARETAGVTKVVDHLEIAPAR
jgi:hyperosmotically inducible protein